MDTQTMQDFNQAYALMGDPFYIKRTEDGAVTNVLWEETLVRQRLNAPFDDLWEQRVLELEAHGLASFTYVAELWDKDEDGNPPPGWEDTIVREDWGTLHIYPRGVLRLAELYKQHPKNMRRKGLFPRLRNNRANLLLGRLFCLNFEGSANKPGTAR
jgi:hypothetical protein